MANWMIEGWAILFWGIAIMLIGVIIGFFVTRWYMKRYLRKNPPINEKMVEQMMSSMGMKPNQKQINKVMKQMNIEK